MKGISGMVKDAEPVIYSHGQYPVAKLKPGMVIRFYSKNFGRQAIVHIKKIVQFNRMLIVDGPELNGVGFWIGDWVEVISMEEQEYAG